MSTIKATTVKTTFSRETSVSIDIHSDASIVWALLTNAADYPRWNSTVISIEGAVALNETIQLKSTLDPKRTFKLKIKVFEPEKQLIWGDGQGIRVYSLAQSSPNTITFSMTEKIGDLMFPLYASYIPPFDQAFDQFAADLKKEAKNVMEAK